MIEISIPGPFRGQARPRFNTKSGRTYTTKEDLNYRDWIRCCYLKDSCRETLIEGPIRVEIKVFYEIPKSTSKINKERMKVGAIWPDKKPDVDNIIKIILDALNGIAYKDDKQVVSLEINKFYAEAPSVFLKLEEL